MIDVSARKIVQYPPDCEYIALSYVWGNVVPKDGALEKKLLPQTIEDAIVVTQQLGKQFLWVLQRLHYRHESFLIMIR